MLCFLQGPLYSSVARSPMMAMMMHTRSWPAWAFTADSLQLSSVLSDWPSHGHLRNGKTVKPQANHQRKCCTSAAFTCKEQICLDQNLAVLVTFTSRYLLFVNYESFLQDFHCASLFLSISLIARVT